MRFIEPANPQVERKLKKEIYITILALDFFCFVLFPQKPFIYLHLNAIIKAGFSFKFFFSFLFIPNARSFTFVQKKKCRTASNI